MVNKKSLNKQSLASAASKIIGLSVLVIGLAAGLALIKTDQNINEDAAPATSLSIVPESQEVRLNRSFSAQVKMDSGENKVTGIDIEMTFDQNEIHIDGIDATSEITNFNTVLKNEVDNSTGVMRYTAFTFDKSLAISGNLTLLTIHGTIPADSRQDSYQINFTDSSVIVAVDEGQNVITNATGGTIKIIGGEPNSCGGTCGSNNNCLANYFCYEGFCRNPVCASDTDCNCTVTAVPNVATARPATSRPTARPVSPVSTRSSSPSPTAISKGGTETLPPNLDYTPVYPDLEREPDATVTTEDLKNQALPKYLKYGAIILLILVVAGLLLWKRKMDMPHILPPTNI